MRKKSRKYPGVYIYKSSVRKGDECYYIMYWAYGRKVNEKVGWKSENYTQEQAHKVRSDRIHAIRHGKELPNLGKKAPTFSGAWGNYYGSILNISEARKALIDNMFKKYLKPEFGKKRLNTITPEQVRTLIRKMQDDGLSKGTISNYMGLISRTYKFMASEGGYKGSNPMDTVKYVNKGNVRKRFLTKKEASLLLKEANKVDRDLYLQIAIGLFTGMRLNEIMNIRGRDINFESGLIKVVGKGSNGTRKERYCEMNDTVKNHLETIKLHPGEKLFKGRFQRHRWEKVIDSLGLNKGLKPEDHLWKVVPHTLRHTFGSWLGQDGVSPYVIMDLMGHDNIQTSMRYTKLGPRAGRDAVGNLTEGMDLTHLKNSKYVVK